MRRMNRRDMEMTGCKSKKKDQSHRRTHQPHHLLRGSTQSLLSLTVKSTQTWQTNHRMSSPSRPPSESAMSSATISRSPGSNPWQNKASFPGIFPTLSHQCAPVVHTESNTASLENERPTRTNNKVSSSEKEQQRLCFGRSNGVADTRICRSNQGVANNQEVPCGNSVCGSPQPTQLCIHAVFDRCRRNRQCKEGFQGFCSHSWDHCEALSRRQWSFCRNPVVKCM